MPKYGIHHIVLDRTRAKLADSVDEKDQTVARILGENPLAAGIGCIGPDLLFWAPDYDVVQFLRDLVGVYDTIKQNVERVEEFVGAIEENIDAGVDAVLTALGLGVVVEYADAFEKLKEGFEALADGLQDEIMKALFAKVLGLDSSGGTERLTLARSLFHGLFQSTHQAGREEMDWYWFEMLHYRNTGDFTKRLIRNAEASGDEQQMAYAYAYVTHYTTDLVGHPFVNTISGSPYRMNVQRHVVIENFMDQWAWGQAFAGKNIRNDLFTRMGFSSEDELPDGIASLLARTLTEVYADVAHPLRFMQSRPPGHPTEAQEAGERSDTDGTLSAADIKDAFTFQKLMLEYLGGQDDQVRPPEPYEGADGDLADLVAGGGVSLPPPPALPTGLPAGPQELLEVVDAWLTAVATYVDELVDVLRDVVDDVVDALAEFLENPTEVLLRWIQLLAYVAQHVMYVVYRLVHQVLALSGLAYPEPDDAALSSPIAESLVTTRQVSYKGFPVLRTPGQPHLDTRSYVDSLEELGDPDFTYKAVERPETVASHYQNEDADTPAGFIDGVPLDVNLFRAYAEARTPADTRKLQTDEPRSFGNAVDLSALILRNKDEGNDLEDVVFCNWNLDGDRGYGYKTWDGVPFTVWRGEIDGAIRGNEPLAEVVQQNYQVWTRATEELVDGDPTTVYREERYVARKPPGSTLLAPLNISELYIPPVFRQPSRMAAVPRDRWLDLVPARFRRLDEQALLHNVFFCNGAGTTPSSGVRCTMALQKTLNAAYAMPADQGFRLKHLHNYSSAEWGDLFLHSDVIQAIGGDYLDAMANAAAVRVGAPLNDVTDATQVAVIALLHHGLERGVPLVLSGHSQGTIITANAVMVFSTLGDEHRSYLREQVKLFHMEPELVEGVRDLLRELVKEYLVYLMNDSDPRGADLLCKFTSGPVPGIPSQTDDLVVAGVGDGMAELASVLANPNPLDIGFYLRLQEIVGGGYADLTALIGYLTSANIEAHFMPVQLAILRDDIVGNRFRTDPSMVADPTVLLSTAAPLPDTSSVDVHDFFVTP